MKIILINFFIILLLYQIALSKKFEFTPLNINYKGIETKNNTVVVYGDFGSMLISYDNAVNWQQKRVFDRGTIVKFFIDNGQMVAFNDVGEIANSKDDGQTWNNVADVNDLITAVIRIPDGYLLRTNNLLFTITNDYKYNKEFPLISIPLGNAYYYSYTKSLAYFNSNLIAATDSAKFIRFDINLNVIDTINFANLTNCQFCQGYYQIESDSNYFYTKIDYQIFKTSDFKTSEIVYDSIDYYKVINNILYYKKDNSSYYYPLSYHDPFFFKIFNVIEKNSSTKIADYVDNDVTSALKLNDFSINNNILILIGNNNLIYKINLIDGSIIKVSDYSGFSPYVCQPDKINDSTFLYYFGNNFYYLPIYKTENKGISFMPVFNYKINPDFLNFSDMQFKYYDSVQKILYLGVFDAYLPNNGGVLISKDLGKSNTFKPISNFNFDTHWPYYPLINLPCLPNIQYNGNNFITAYNIFWKYNNIEHNYTNICTYSKDFDVVSKYKDSNMIVDYINSKDTNTFLIHCENSLDTTFEFKYTNNHGADWEVIKKYQFTDSMLYYKELEINNKTQLALFYISLLDSVISIDLLDIESHIINKIYDYKLKILDYESRDHYGIFYDSKLFYLAIEDTLFYTNNLFDRKNWKKYYFPNHGKIIRTFTKFGDIYYGRYSDDVIADNIYWIKIIDSFEQLIIADDYDFGKHDIKKNEILTHTIRIQNPSNDEDLIITGYSIISDTTFKSYLPQIDSNNTLTIKPGQYFAYQVTFEPKEKRLYKDSIVFYTNSSLADNVTYLFGDGIDTATTVVDMKIEELNYLYAYPPFPIPAKREVKALIYWDLNIDIDNDEIEVYNVFGEKINGRENILINKLSPYSGYLIWDCSNLESGIYFVQIKHGNASLTIKVMVNR